MKSVTVRLPDVEYVMLLDLMKAYKKRTSAADFFLYLVRQNHAKVRKLP